MKKQAEYKDRHWLGNNSYLIEISCFQLNMHYALDVSLYVKIKAILSCQQKEKLTQHGLWAELESFSWYFKVLCRRLFKTDMSTLNLQLRLPLSLYLISEMQTYYWIHDSLTDVL